MKRRTYLEVIEECELISEGEKQEYKYLVNKANEYKKKAHTIYKRAYFRLHKKELLDYQRKYRDRNREQVNAIQRKYDALKREKHSYLIDQVKKLEQELDQLRRGESK